MRVLCLNAGSSSLKFAVYSFDIGAEDLVRVVSSESATSDDDGAALELALAAGGAEPLAAVGHRIVFGGPAYGGPTLVDDRVLADLGELAAVEPLHLPCELDLVRAVRRRFPALPQVLCFDTAFHRGAPAIARKLPLPRDIDPLLQRYGFHGLSYEYVASQLSEDSGRTIVAHLGSGASLCALRDGSPVDTTMGFSALGGLMMATRPGDLDPGVVLRLLSGDRYDGERLNDLFYHRSGLRGVSGSTGDMKTLVAESVSDPHAREAVELFVYLLVKQLGAMVAVLGGLDGLVFTGGIGEHAPSLRAAAAAALSYLGAALDPAANERNARVVSTGASRVLLEVIPTDENLVIARHTAALMKKAS